MALLCGRAGRLTAEIGGFRPGQMDDKVYENAFKYIAKEYFTKELKHSK